MDGFRGSCGLLGVPRTLMPNYAVRDGEIGVLPIRRFRRISSSGTFSDEQAISRSGDFPTAQMEFARRQHIMNPMNR